MGEASEMRLRERESVRECERYPISVFKHYVCIHLCISMGAPTGIWVVVPWCPFTTLFQTLVYEGRVA